MLDKRTDPSPRMIDLQLVRVGSGLILASAISTADTPQDGQRVSFLLARMERLPICSWHIHAAVGMGLGTFFDAYGTLSIGYVIPVLAILWKLSPKDIGFLISASFVGQIVGGVVFGWLAERIGRVRAAVYAVAIYAITSLLCALAWNFASLLMLRTIQGIGLGGEVPVGATYVNEISRTKGRGRFFLLYELIFPTGLTSAALLGYWLVPRFGWQSLFITGGVAGLLSMLVIRRLSESPRWLISKGRLEGADKVVSEIETEAVRGGYFLQPVASLPAAVRLSGSSSWKGLFEGIYLSRTLVVWGLAFFSYFVAYGFNTWLPTIYRTYYHLSVSTALLYGLLTNIAGLLGTFLCAMLIDRIGRRIGYIAAFALGSVPLLALWQMGAASAKLVFWLSSVSFFFISASSMLFFLYTPEVYPTRLRGLGTGIASCWLRISSAMGPSIVGFILISSGMPGVFRLFGILSVTGALVAFATTETTNRSLEELSP